MNRLCPLFAGLLTVVALGTAACGDLTPANQAIVVAPTPRPTATTTSVPPVDLAVVYTKDVTTSADRYGERALEVLSTAVADWPAPERGGLEVYLNVLSSTSYDAGSTVFVGAIAGLPGAPVLRPVLARPSQPDLAHCQANAFARSKCEGEIIERYNAALASAVEDERIAGRELDEATMAYTELLSVRRAEASALAEALDSIALPIDDRGTDIDGALARAAEQLRTSRASRKLLILWSDLEPYGAQHPGAIDLSNIEIVVVLDCHQGVDCAAHRTAFSDRVLALGALSIQWIDPSVASLTNLLDVQ